MKVPGNDAVIEGLELALKRARQGTVRAVGVILCEHGADSRFIGDENSRPNCYFGAGLLQRIIMDSLGTVQDMKDQPPANVVSFDVNLNQVCFDFIPWLATQEMIRRREGAPAPLRVIFKASPYAINNYAVLRAGFIRDVIRPSLPLFGATEGYIGERARERGFAGLRDVAAGFNDGEEVPTITVPEPAMEATRKALQGRKPVTITLRETEYSTHRNSNIEEWRKLAMWLCSRGEDVIIIRDTAKASEGFPGFEICPAASKDLHTRSALYTQAKCNLFVQNGPFSLAQFSKTPWLLFASVDDEQPEEYNRPDKWGVFVPTNAEGQLLWATPQQRIIYGKDDFEVMQPAYEELGL